MGYATMSEDETYLKLYTEPGPSLLTQVLTRPDISIRLYSIDGMTLHSSKQSVVHRPSSENTPADVHDECPNNVILSTPNYVCRM